MSLSGKIFTSQFSDTISAIATAPGQAAISVIRISGPKSISIAEKIFQGKVKLSRAKANTIHFGKIVDPTSQTTIDEVLVSVFRAPMSYTGENMIEISGHGGDFVANRILNLIIKLGGRLAEPGEFTKRRVLNGKIDITQAEAILDLVSARNEVSCQSALDQMQGKLSGYIKELTDEITNILSRMENLLEFEEDIDHIRDETSELTNHIQKISDNLQQTIIKNEQLKFLRNGIYCVIVGRPNVGKSSLFNRLSEIDKAIVTNIAGTTRDSLEQVIWINGIAFHLVDTAGLKRIKQKTGAAVIEAIGIQKSHDWLKSADFVLAVFDNSQPIKRQDYLVYNLIKNKPHLLIVNKIDLRSKFDTRIFNNNKFYPISAKYNTGIAKLKQAMVKHYSKKLSAINNDYLYLNQRHIEVLNRVAASLKQSVQEKYLDCAIMHLRNALDMLGAIVNPVTNEQVLDSIFNQFCIGK